MLAFHQPCAYICHLSLPVTRTKLRPPFLSIHQHKSFSVHSLIHLPTHQTHPIPPLSHTHRPYQITRPSVHIRTPSLHYLPLYLHASIQIFIIILGFLRFLAMT